MAFSKELRMNLTPAEATLWLMLKGKQLEDRKFRRQHCIGNYIIDFYCISEKLGIELDGNEHYTPIGKQNDIMRTEILHKSGITILRFENKAIFQFPDMVIAHIVEHFNAEPPPSGKT